MRANDVNTGHPQRAGTRPPPSRITPPEAFPCRRRGRSAARAVGRPALILAIVAASTCLCRGAVPGTLRHLRVVGPRTEDLRLGLSYPPLADVEQRTFTAEHLRALGVRHIRYETRWALREPRRGRFDWAPLDARMAFCERENLSLMLTVRADGPDWAVRAPRNPQSAVIDDTTAFTNFIARLVQRYPGAIDKIQFGNEWHATYWYAGTAEDYVRSQNLLYDTVKAYAPGIEVVLGGFSVGALRALAAIDGLADSYMHEDGRVYSGEELTKRLTSARAMTFRRRVGEVLASARFDVLDLHLYDDPERWQLYVATMRRRVPGKPIIVSEFGGPHAEREPTTAAYQAERLRYYIQALCAIEQVREAYFFTLVRLRPEHCKTGHGYSCLIGPAKEQKPAYDVFASFTRPAASSPDTAEGATGGDAHAPTEPAGTTTNSPEPSAQ